MKKLAGYSLLGLGLTLVVLGIAWVFIMMFAGALAYSCPEWEREAGECLEFAGTERLQFIALMFGPGALGGLMLLAAKPLVPEKVWAKL